MLIGDTYHSFDNVQKINQKYFTIMTKMISAQQILKQKGYVQSKFDTNGFMNAVAQYFIDNDVESKLLLFPFRFLDIKVDKENDPCNLVKKEDLPSLSVSDRIAMDNMDFNAIDHTCPNPFDIGWQDRLLGYKVQTKMDPVENYPEWAMKLGRYDWEALRIQQEAGLDKPRIIIDSPFFENAAGMLRVMGGFVVEPKRKKGKKLYTVMLV